MRAIRRNAKGGSHDRNDGEAMARFQAAEQAARSDGDNATQVECLRMEAMLQRFIREFSPDRAAAAGGCRTVTQVTEDDSQELAGIQEEIVAALRAQGRNEQALVMFKKAVRQGHPDWPRSDLGARSDHGGGAAPESGNRPKRQSSR